MRLSPIILATLLPLLTTASPIPVPAPAAEAEAAALWPGIFFCHLHPNSCSGGVKKRGAAPEPEPAAIPEPAAEAEAAAFFPAFCRTFPKACPLGVKERGAAPEPEPVAVAEAEAEAEAVAAPEPWIMRPSANYCNTHPTSPQCNNVSKTKRGAAPEPEPVAEAEAEAKADAAAAPNFCGISCSPYCVAHRTTDPKCKYTL
jgi:hypothetical protein